MIFSTVAHGSVTDNSIAPSSTAGNTIWLDAFINRSDIITGNLIYLHNNTSSVHGGTVSAPADTDPFRASKIDRLCWNDYQQTISTTSPTPSASQLYWANINLPAAGTYDLGLRWATGA